MLRKVFSAFISLVLLLTLLPMTTLADKAGCNDFVSGLYLSTLERIPDQSGLDSWSSMLESHQTTGVAVAYGFIFSEEFKARNLSDPEFVDVLYKALLGREADEAGKAGWVAQLESGTSRETLFAGFANSPEFYWHCTSFGIAGGTYIQGRDLNKVTKTNLYIDRLYKDALGRNADREGMNSWTAAAVDGSATGASIAYDFFFSNEYQAQKKSNDRFVTDLYRVLLNREPGSTEVQSWTGLLNGGYSREQVFSEFVNSGEFAYSCSECGITSGLYIAGADRNTVNMVSQFANRLYTIVLGRSSDTAGLYYWTTALMNRESTGADTAFGFFFSNEYRGRRRSDAEFITDLYNVMLDRQPDQEGLKSWTDKLGIGYSRKLVFAGFVNSAEFTAICQNYGIVRGDYMVEGWCYEGNNKIYIKNGDRLYGWASIDGGYYFFNRKTGILATNTTVNQIAVDGNGRAEDTEFARQKIPVMIRAREIYLSITNPSMSVYEKQMACCNYVMPMPYLMKDYTVGRHANNWACLTAHYANNLLNAYGDQAVCGGECFAEACALAYLFNEIDEGQVYVNRDEMHGWVEMNGMFWDPLFAESRGKHYLNMDPHNYEYLVPPFQYPL